LTDSSRYQVRALDRALVIVRALNQHNGLNASELSRLVKLPRPTVLRLLQTMTESGYVLRSPSDGCFRVSRRIRELSSGFRELDWVGSAVRPFLADLTARLVWPLAVVRFYGGRLVVEALTDHGSPMLMRRETPGAQLPLLTSASGYLTIAGRPAEDRAKLAAQAYRADADLLRSVGLSERDVFRHIEETVAKGYAVLHLDSHSAVSVPVPSTSVPDCALNMRIHASRELRAARIEENLALLQGAAATLAARIDQLGTSSH
jgi:IclR family mhp operon transcriptional activator